MDELMTIGAFAERTGLSVSAIRFYASQGLLVPADVDESSGYRRYAADQVADGVLIRDLRRLEMPLADISVALQLSDVERKGLVEEHLLRLEVIVQRAHELARQMGPATTSKETVMTTTLPASDLVHALQQVLPAAGVDAEAPHLMGVLVEAKEGTVRFVATDRYRLAVRDLVPSSAGADFTAVVPAATLAQWPAHLPQQGTVTLGVGDDGLRVRGDDVDLAAPLVPVEFPDYEKFLDGEAGSTSVRVDRRLLLAALPDDATMGTEITVTISPDRLRVTDDAGSTDLDAVVDGDAQRVTLDAKFVADAVRGGVGVEMVIEIDDPFAVVLFRSADDGTFTTRIMPIKVDRGPGARVA